jgi:hypothetical protein
VDFLALFIQDAIAPGGRFRDDIARLVEEHSRRTGYTPTPEALAREMAYVLLNKIVFYKVPERYYKLPRLEPLYERGIAKTKTSGYGGDTISREARRLLSINEDSAVGRISRIPKNKKHLNFHSTKLIS